MVSRVSARPLGARSVRGQSATTKVEFLKLKFLLKILVLAVFWVCLSLVYTWSRVQIVQMGIQLNHQKDIHKKLLDQNQRLQMELAWSVSPQTVIQKAKDIGMRYPSHSVIFEVTEEP